MENKLLDAEKFLQDSENQHQRTLQALKIKQEERTLLFEKIKKLEETIINETKRANDSIESERVS